MYQSDLHKAAYDPQQYLVPQQFMAKSADGNVQAVRAALPDSKSQGLDVPLEGANKMDANKTAKLLEELPNDWTFTEDDMVDWLGRKYSILIWGKNRGVPGYRADPEVCLGNVSCKITYLYSDKADSHAIVFRHNVGIGDSGNNRYVF